MSRAQTATEYLIIVGVTIVIALIVASAFTGIPGVSVKLSRDSMSARLGSLPVGITNYKVSCENTSIRVINNYQKAVRINNLVVNNSECITGTLPVLAVGQNKLLTCTAITNCNAGDSYQYSLEVNWTDIETQARFRQFDNGINLVGVVSTT